MTSTKTPGMLLDARDVIVEFPMKGWRTPPFRALHGVSVQIAEHETVGLVGESGSGKSTLGRAILGLAPVTGGAITFKGQDITHASGQARRRLGSSIQVIFQDPYSSLNPMMTIGDILTEPLLAQSGDRKGADALVKDLLDKVQMPRDTASRTPREFSGGQRQRIAIARALAMEPELIICDEPTSALDLSTQARVLDLLIELQQRTGVAYLFVSHDLAVVRHISHRVAVMRGGEIVETGDGESVTSNPTHPYTKRLLMAAPVPNPAEQAERRRARHELLAQLGDDAA
ncbi:MAG: ATP-binding cassette domain-containing protein [Actinomycetales bacterium]